MTVIKTLDKGPYFWHEYEKPIPAVDENGKPIRDRKGNPLYEQPKNDWLLPYEPVYILTNEVRVVAQLFALRDNDPMTVDIANADEYPEETPWLRCSLDKQLMPQLSL